MNRDPEIPTTQDPAPSRPEEWLDRWLVVRSRAFITWMFMASCSVLLLAYGLQGWITPAARFVERMMRTYLGFAPPTHLLVTCNIFALLSWYEPVILRLGVIRSVLWVLAFWFLGLVAPILGVQNGSVYVGIALWRGLPGLVAIGARQRAWLTLVAAALSVASLPVVLALGRALYWDFNKSGWFLFGFLLAQIPYAAVMIYGTSPLRDGTLMGA